MNLSCIASDIKSKKEQNNYICVQTFIVTYFHNEHSCFHVPATLHNHFSLRRIGDLEPLFAPKQSSAPSHEGWPGIIIHKIM